MNFRRYGKFICLFGMITAGVAAANPGVCADKMIAGWLEMVRIYPGNLDIKAKLDTGARTSSLNATAMEKIERGGENWIRFRVIDHTGKKIFLEKKISRLANIKLRNRQLQERPVVILGICLGGIYKETEVNLVDRSYFNYQLLLGRSFLADTFLVDSASKYITRFDCRKDDGHE